MKRYAIKFAFITFVIIFCSCCTDPPIQKLEKEGNTLSLTSAELVQSVNNKLAKDESLEIKAYIERREAKGDTFISLPTGIFYRVYHKTKDVFPSNGDRVSFTYRLYLINGTEIDSSKMDFIIGQNAPIRGLDVALSLLRRGEKAQLIIPSFQAYGLTGYLDKIPKRATLIYDLTLDKVSVKREMKD